VEQISLLDKVPYINLSAQWDEDRAELLPLIERVLSSGSYIGGECIERFEREVASYCGTHYAVALNSGTDALVCALHALGIGNGDEVITPPNSFIASTASIIHVGARPVFVDVQRDQNIDWRLIEASLTPRTRAIMPVHLTGRVADMVAINSIAKEHGLYVIEDAAQSVGSRLNDYASGSLGTIGCFSTHPLKNLNACGDGGFITSNNEEVVSRIRLYRNHGLIDRDNVEQFGMVSRMDALQAEILTYRLEKLPKVIEARRRNARIYQEKLDPSAVFFPRERKCEFNTYHTFVVQTEGRDQLRSELRLRGIETAIHYPIPIHLQPAALRLGYKMGDFSETEKQAKMILTLPVNQYLNESEIGYIADTVNEIAVGSVGV
jgi:dTDP-4-amino-4,6-dideoxygalactose transaminase